MRNQLIMKYPASCYKDAWREAFPVGNGEIGALVYGGVGHEIIALNHSRLWRDKKIAPLPDVHEALTKMRTLLAENKVKEAENVLSEALKEKGFKGETFGKPLPLCDIDIVTDCHAPFKHYRRFLNMDTAETVVCWHEEDTFFKRRAFVSRENDVFYCKITAEGTKKYNALFDLKVHDLQTIGDLTPPEGVTDYKENTVFFHSEWDEPYGAVLQISHDGKSMVEQNGIRVTDASQIELKLKAFVDGDALEQFKEIEQDLSDAPDYDTAFKSSSALHNEIFGKTVFKLGNGVGDTANELLLMDAYDSEMSEELTEKLWSFGRYLLVCANKEGGLPCHLYGLWCGDYNGMWAYNMFNVNIEMIYWQALSGNMPELLLNVFNYVESHMDDYRENAKKLFECRGINICSVSTPESGLHKLLYPHILHWTGGAGWIAQHYFDYYLHTRDAEFLKTRALPFMYETALFYEDYLSVGEDGYLVSSPSNSPENVPGNVLHDLKCNSEVNVNATMDFAIVKELLSNLLEGAQLCGMYVEKMEKWREMLNKIPPYQVNEDGALAEWMHPFYRDNYQHRHESHLYPVFPGKEITRNNNPELHKAAEVAVEKREVVGIKEQSGWSMAYMANVYARLGQGDKALNAIDILAKSCVLSNFFTTHNDWRRMGIVSCMGMETKAPVQLDANMGITSAIHEMFVFSAQNELYLFPALPERWGSGTIGPLLTSTNTEVTLTWNENKAVILLKQLQEDADLILILPEKMYFELNGSQEMQMALSADETIEITVMF
ncbi:MAG: glycoside hydrolase N-terminal domain-containing protein [Clostridia bacterium]|nr:glycoside hydrolase N-terminal domain-containing protein [Clostridia bacterium]